MNTSLALGLHPTQTATTGLAVVSGYVSTEQAPPTSLDDLAYIVIPSHSTESGQWLSFMAMHGATIPGSGTAVLVAYDENAVPYVIWWAGSYTAPSAT